MLRMLMALALAAWALPALAAEPIAIAAGAPYRHAPTGLTVPATLAGLPRTKAQAIERDLDEFVGFETPKVTEALTVFVFRHTNGDVPVWFDRIRWQVEHRDVYGGAARALDRPAPFAPPGQKTASGLMLAFTPSGGPFRGSAAALMPLGPDWFVAVRYSSSTLDAAALADRMPGVIAALGWPAKIAPSPAAALIEPCRDTLKFSGDAQPMRRDPMDALVSSGAEAAVAPKSGMPLRWCADRQASEGLDGAAVYRFERDRSAYLLAFGDAGRAAWAGRDMLGTLLAPQTGLPPGWSVRLTLLDRAVIFPAVDRLPPPRQLRTLIGGQSVGSVSTWPKTGDVSIILPPSK